MKMWRYFGVTLLVLATVLGTAWSQDSTDFISDGPCPDIGSWRPVNWRRLLGSWNEILRMPNGFQTNQCPTSNNYSGVGRNITNTVTGILPDGSEFSIVAPGIIQSDGTRLVPDPPVSIYGVDSPNGLTLETIYTNYRSLHVFMTCLPLDGNQNIHFVWIESRRSRLPKITLRNTLRYLSRKGIDVSRFWKVGLDYCTEE